MKTWRVEVGLCNEDYADGFRDACEDFDGAKADWAIAMNFEREDLGLPKLTKKQKAAIRPLSAEFTECDSTRSHGCCYFEVTLEVPDEIFEEMDKASAERDVREHTGD